MERTGGPWIQRRFKNFILPKRTRRPTLTCWPGWVIESKPRYQRRASSIELPALQRDEGKEIMKRTNINSSKVVSLDSLLVLSSFGFFALTQTHLTGSHHPITTVIPGGGEGGRRRAECSGHIRRSTLSGRVSCVQEAVGWAIQPQVGSRPQARISPGM